MTCTDYARHERLPLDCTHTGRNGTEVLVRFADGCSGRLCTDCDRELGIRRQPDLAERIPGPATGLDTLQLLRAHASPRDVPRA